MHDLLRRTLIAALWSQAILAALIFLPAWSLRYWQGWLYWWVFLVCTLTSGLYFLRHDPALVERRMKGGPAAEQRTVQKAILTIAFVSACALIVLSAFDHRFGWSRVPAALAIAGDGLVILSFFIFFVVFRENSFASSTIEINAGQTVIATGPYALVRHPMYAGALLLIFGTPLALASWWGFVPAVLLAGVIVWRLLDEEEFLSHDLPGYNDYRRNVRWRLLPGVW